VTFDNTPVAPAATSVPAEAPIPFIAKPRPDQTTMNPAEIVDFSDGQAREWGVSRLPMLGGTAYSIALSEPFRQAFIDQLGYWNRYSAGSFAFFPTPNFTIGWPNNRNETGFLTNAQVNNLYGFDYGGNVLAVCFTRLLAIFNTTAEADIAYNPAFSFAVDPNVTYSNPLAYSFRQVALHELGHAFGRQHAWDSDPAGIYPSTMNYFPDGFYQAEGGRVFTDDAQSIRAAYSGGSVNQTDFGIYLWSMNGTRSGGDPSVNVVRNLSMQGAVLQGNSFSISNAWIENVGTVTRDTHIDFWLTPTARDHSLAGGVYCSSSTIGTLSRGSGVSYNTFVTVPQTMPPGQYYLCAIISQVDAFPDNDFAWSRNTIRVDYNSAFAPPNDRRTSPQAIGIGTFTGSTQFATNDGTASCGLSNTSPDVWFTFTAPYAGYFEADTCQGSGFDNVLSLEQRGNFGIYTEVACNDDSIGGDCNGSNRARVFLNNIPAGTVLRIRLSGFNGARGPYSLRTRMYPSNDFCSAAVPVGTGTYTATLAGATNDQTGSCGLTSTTPDVWFRYTWPQGCNTVNLNTIGSDFDTVLEVFNLCSPFQIARGCNDDCGAVGPSCLTITRGAESSLRIRVTRYGGTPAAGNYIVLNVSTGAAAHDICSGAMPLADGDYGFDNRCGSTDNLPMPSGCFSSECVNDFWFRYTAPITGRLQVAIGTPFPAAIVFYPGFTCPGNPEEAIACDIGTPGAFLSANVVQGESVLIRVGGSVQPGFGTPIGTGTISIQTVSLPPMNDACETAQGVSPGEVVTGNLALATADGSSTSDLAPGGQDVWFAFTSPGPGVLFASTCGTYAIGGLDTVVSIHSGCPGDTVSEIVSSDGIDAGGCAANAETADPADGQTTIGTEGGFTYFIRVAATDPALVGTGDFVLNVVFSLSSDTCGNSAVLIDGDTFFSTSAATPDGTVDSVFDGSETDVWYTYTASCTGTTRISTCGQPYDTKLAIYFSADCPTGEPIASNDDNGIECQGIAASVEFASVQGQIYNVRIGGIVPQPGIISVSCTPFNADVIIDNLSEPTRGVTVLGTTPPDNVWVAQGFTVPNPVTLDSVTMLIGIAVPGTDAVAQLRRGEDPGAPIVATFTLPPLNEFGVTGVTLVPDVPVVLEPGQTHWLVLGTSSTGSFGLAYAEGNNWSGPGTIGTYAYSEDLGVTWGAAGVDNPYKFRLVGSPAPTDPADFNGDGEVNPDDLADYIGAYFSQPADPRADFNGDGEINPDDLADYIGAYFS